MARFKKLFDFYLNSSLHVALAVTAFAALTGLHLQIRSGPELLLFIFAGTVAGYNLIRYHRPESYRFPRAGDFPVPVLAVTLFCGLVASLLAFRLRLPVLAVAAGLGLATLLYAAPFGNSRQNLRSITGIKIFVIAAVWTGTTVFLPVLDAGVPATANVLLLTLQRFLFVIVLTLPFDIRDYRSDPDMLATIPQQFGVTATRRIGLVLLAAVILLETAMNSTQQELLITALISFITAGFILKSGIRQNRYFASFWIEGIPVLWFVLLVVSGWLL